MRYKPNAEESRRRWLEFWDRENHDRPLLDLAAVVPDARPRPVPAPPTLYERWTDIDYRIALNRSHLDGVVYVGDSFPVMWPNLGPDFLGATFGADLIFQETTSYSVPCLTEDSPLPEFLQDNSWWQRMVAMTRAFVEDAQGDYLVGITDLHPGMDGVVSLRGAEQTALDMVDRPEQAVALARRLSEAYLEQLRMLHGITSKNGPAAGCSNWMNIWHPELWYVTSCDFICMISREMFDAHIAPLLQWEARMLDGRTLFHLDGPGALRHLDALLDIPEIAGIQWVPGAAQPSARAWIPLLQKIQSRGRLLNIEAGPEDLPVLARELQPEGLSIRLSFSPTLSEAEDILRLVTRA